ncbi:MAG: TlpA family protein disulfide reductase [Cytophagaceae bacterium]|jgi:thiol-disulfide isomerase/thioredoxin|nr:TlpA family protein disulfide reductase [Cytophagaceae bacterium]
MKKKKSLSGKWYRYCRRKRWWSIIFDFVLLTMVVILLIPSTRRSVTAFVLRNTLLPPRESSKTIFLSDNDLQLQFYDQNEDTMVLKNFDNKPVFINFWATWCPYCVAEMPSLQKLYDRYKSKVHFLFITGEPAETVEQFLTKNGYSLPCYFYSGKPPEIFEHSSIPATYLIENGRLIVHKTGSAKWDARKFFQLMDKLVAEGKNLTDTTNLLPY